MSSHETRRGFLLAVAGLLGGALAVALGWLAALFLGSAAAWGGGPDRWIRLCRLDELPADEPLPRTLSFDRREGWYWQSVQRQVYVRRDTDGAVEVLSRRCTHLGCPVTWKQGSRTFKCPCHEGVFGEDGGVVSGPPPRPLERVPARIQGEDVEVQAR